MLNQTVNNFKLILCVLALILTGFLVQVGATYILDAIFIMFPSLVSVQADYVNTISDLTTMEAKMLVYVCFFAPLVEELVFRLGLIGLGRKIVKFWIVNVIQAILFGIYHGNIVQGCYAFLLGLFLGVMFEYGGGFFTTFIIHVVINTSGLYITPLLPANIAPVYKIVVGLICAVICVVSSIFVVKVIARQSAKGTSDDI